MSLNESSPYAVLFEKSFNDQKRSSKRAHTASDSLHI